MFSRAFLAIFGQNVSKMARKPLKWAKNLVKPVWDPLYGTPHMPMQAALGALSTVPGSRGGYTVSVHHPHAATDEYTPTPRTVIFRKPLGLTACQIWSPDTPDGSKYPPFRGFYPIWGQNTPFWGFWDPIWTPWPGIRGWSWPPCRLHPSTLRNWWPGSRFLTENPDF